MKPIRSVLVPLFPAGARSTLQNAALLADWLQADLHVLVEPARSRSAQALLNLIAARCERPLHAYVHEWRGDELERFLATVEASEAGLVVLGLERTQRELSHRPGSLVESILEQCPVPVLLAPAHRSLRRRPIDSLLVAVSGESRSDKSIELAIRVANAGRIPVDILHVTPQEGSCSCEAVRLEGIEDQFLHEYPKHLEQIVAQASPFSTPRECRCIRGFTHCYGDVADQVHRMLRNRANAMLVLQWKGSLSKGRARTLRQILSQSEAPVLLTRSRAPSAAQLKIGERFGT